MYIGELKYIDHNNYSIFNNDIGFFGNPNNHESRKTMLYNIKLSLYNNSTNPYNLTYLFKPKSYWLKDMSTTLFNLAPRGFGRSSFRITEIIQIGRIPIYLYDDIPWIPYEGTDKDYYSLGIVNKRNNVNMSIDLIEQIYKIKSNESIMKSKLYKVLKYRKSHYTYKGVMEQIHLFFKDPLGSLGGDLKFKLS